MLDGTHVKIDIRGRDNKDTVPKHEYKSTKDNTKGRYCFNFVVVFLPNGFTADVFYPVPCKRSDSQSMQDGKNPITNELNYQRLNKRFGQTDTGLGDCNFVPFSRRTKGGGMCLVIVG
jgi:hypothetical protein